jgi:hypothetical protein
VPGALSRLVTAQLLIGLVNLGLNPLAEMLVNRVAMLCAECLKHLFVWA